MSTPPASQLLTKHIVTLVEDVDEERLDVGLRDELPARVRELGHEASEGKKCFSTNKFEIFPVFYFINYNFYKKSLNGLGCNS